MSFSKIIIAAAVAVFVDYPEADEVYVTEDGNAFLPHVKHLARTHAVQAKLPSPVCVTRSMEHLGEMYEQVTKVGNGAPDRENKEREEREAEAARLAADEATAAAQAEEAAAAEAAARDDRDAEERAQDAANLAAAAEAKAAADKAKADAKAKEAKPATTKGGQKGK